MTTKLTSKTQRGCASEEPDEGNLQVRFCEGAHSITLGLLPHQKVGYGLYSTCTRIRLFRKPQIRENPSNPCHPCSLRFDEYYFFNPYNHANNITFFISCCHIWAYVHKRNKNHTNLHWKRYLNIANFHQPRL
jgi:hypothetical protein